MKPVLVFISVCLLAIAAAGAFTLGQQKWTPVPPGGPDSSPDYSWEKSDSGCLRPTDQTYRARLDALGALLFGAATYSDDPAIQQVLISKASERLRFLFGVADQQLQGRDYLAGKRSLADPYLYVVMRWAQAKQLDLGNTPDLQRFFKRMDADEGVRRALKKQGL